MDGTLHNWQQRFGDVVGTIRQTNPNDSDISVADTVGVMAAHVNQAMGSPQIANALVRAGCVPSDSEQAKCGKVFAWIKRNVKFVRDEEQLEKMFASPESKELLITPQVLLSMPKPCGDCDDFSMLCASMLEAQGIKASFVTIAAERELPNQFTHIYVVAHLKDGRNVPMDCSHGRNVGWELEEAYRKQIWPIMTWHKGENMSKGLGDFWIDDGEGSYVPPGLDTTYGTFGGNTVGSSMSFSSMLNNLLPGIAQTGEKFLLQTTQKPGYQTTTVGPNGQMQTTSMVAQPGQTVPNISLPGFGSGSVSPVLLIGGLAAIFILYKVVSK